MLTGVPRVPSARIQGSGVARPKTYMGGHEMLSSPRPRPLLWAALVVLLASCRSPDPAVSREPALRARSDGRSAEGPTTLDVVLVDRHGRVVAEPIDVAWTQLPWATDTSGNEGPNAWHTVTQTGGCRVRGGRMSLTAEVPGCEIALETQAADRHTAWTNITSCPVCKRHTAFVRVGDKQAHLTLRLVDQDGTALGEEPLVVVRETGPAQRRIRTPSQYIAACDRARKELHNRMLASADAVCPGHATAADAGPPFGTQGTILCFGGLEAATEGNGNLTIPVSADLEGQIVVMPSPWHSGLIGTPTQLPAWALSGDTLAVVRYPKLRPGECRDLGVVRVSRDPLLVRGEVRFGESALPPSIYLGPLVLIGCKVPGSSFWESVGVPSPNDVTYPAGRTVPFSYHARPTPGALYQVRAGTGPWVTFVPGETGVVVHPPSESSKPRRY